ncbi:hypothetical protein LXL04_020452 [Taraxacum kok-saghyz]
MAELPLETSLARTLIEANEYGCLPQALSVAAMLSVEAKTQKKKKKNHSVSELPDGSGWGDHVASSGWGDHLFHFVFIKLLYSGTWDVICQRCEETVVANNAEGCKRLAMKYKKGLVNKRKEGEKEKKIHLNLRKAFCVGYASQMAERIMHHNAYRTPQLVQICIVLLLCLEQWWIQPVSESSGGPKKAIKNGGPLDDSNTRIQVAQDRFLSRKGNK